MKRYKCLHGAYNYYRKGVIYDGDKILEGQSRSPEELSRRCKEDWQLVENDEIIGYKLKENCEKYRGAAAKIACNVVYERSGCDFKNHTNIERLREAKVIDLWFEPVYAPKYTLPKINGYDGKVGKGTSSETFKSSQTVEYGCATINVQWLRNIYKLQKANGCSGVGNRELNSITLDSGVTIRVEQMKQIVEYFDNL